MDDDPWSDLGGNLPTGDTEPADDTTGDLRCRFCGLLIEESVPTGALAGSGANWRHVATGFRPCFPPSVGLWAEP